MFIVRNKLLICIGTNTLFSKKTFGFFNDPKEINVIIEMQYLPEEYRARLVGYLRCLRDDMKK